MFSFHARIGSPHLPQNSRLRSQNDSTLGERTGLKQEPFVAGADEMIARIVHAKGIPNAEEGFALTFSDKPFADHDAELDWLRAEDNGNVYQGIVAGEEMEGWLCPALFCYFTTVPLKIYVKAEPLPAGVDPLWHVDPDDPRARRFVEPDGE